MAEQERQKKIRYAVVGLGWIAQEAILPAFRNAKNSEVAALVSDDPAKARELGKAYRKVPVYSYAQYDELLKSGSIDAVFITLPNSMHAEYCIRAAHAGVHILCEKPLARNARECEEIIQAARDHGVKLMVAYRLHFEPANLKVVDMVESGKLGEPRIFSSCFSQQVAAGNIRLRKDLAGGPLMDMGVYPINTSRYVFRDEPTEVVAFGANNGEERFKEVHEAVSAVLRFPGDKLASFTCSFGAAKTDYWMVVGTEGSARLEPGFGYHDIIKLQAKIGNKEKEKFFPKHDQFGAEIKYFSDCILENREPEPGGREGLADLRVIDALLESIRTKKPVSLPPFTKEERPDVGQAMELPPVKPEEIVHAESPSGAS